MNGAFLHFVLFKDLLVEEDLPNLLINFATFLVFISPVCKELNNPFKDCLYNEPAIIKWKKPFLHYLLEFVWIYDLTLIVINDFLELTVEELDEALIEELQFYFVVVWLEDYNALFEVVQNVHELTLLLDVTDHEVIPVQYSSCENIHDSEDQKDWGSYDWKAY